MHSISRIFCEAKSHPKNKNSKLDICPNIFWIKGGVAIELWIAVYF